MEDGRSVTRMDGEAVGQPTRYRIRDGATGRLLHEWKGPAQDYPFWESSRLSVVAGVNSDAWKGDSEEPYQLLDLRTGVWTPLCKTLLHVEAEHSARPWILIDDGTADRLRLRVFDVDTKAWLLDWSATPPAPGVEEEVNRAWFEDEELVVVVEHRRRWGSEQRHEPYPETQRLERWNVPSKTRIANAPIEPTARYVVPWPKRRMLLLGRSSLPDSASIVELQTMQTVFMTPHLDEEERAWLQLPMRVILPRPSASGRTLLSRLGRLWSIEEGRVLWRHSKTESVDTPQVSSEAFRVREDWTPLLKAVHLPFSLTTIAIRGMETGAVQYRTFVPPPYDGAARVENDELRPAPNWSLLVVCQAILGLPLVLIWLWLRARSKRRVTVMGAG